MHVWIHHRKMYIIAIGETGMLKSVVYCTNLITAILNNPIFATDCNIIAKYLIGNWVCKSERNEIYCHTKFLPNGSITLFIKDGCDIYKFESLQWFKVKIRKMYLQYKCRSWRIYNIVSVKIYQKKIYWENTL